MKVMKVMKIMKVMKLTMPNTTTAAVAAILASAILATVTAAADDTITFDDTVLAVLRQRCGGCHNSDKKSGDLDITSYSGLMQGGGSGGVIEPGNASGSYLYKLITHQDEPKMPPDSPPIPEEEQALIKKWIDGGVLENKGSKVAAPKKNLAMAMDAAPTKRPAVTPLPARIPLEPVIRTRGLNACASIATSPWAALAAVCGQKQVLLYRTDTRHLAGVLPFPEGRPQVLQFSRSGSLLLAGGGRGGASGRVVVWDVVTGRRVTELGAELDTVLAADISADKRFVALGGPQRIVRIYSTETGELLHELRKHTDWITAASFSADGLLLATSDRNGGVIVWEAATGRDFLALSGHTGSVTSLSWRADSNLLATGSEDGTIRLWEMENGGQVKSWNAHAGGVAALDFTRDGRIVSVGRDKIPKIWAQDGNQQKAFEACADVGLAISYCDETDSVIVGDWTGEIRIWKGADAVRLGGLSSNPETLAERAAAAERVAAERVAAAAPARIAAETAQAQMEAMQNQFDEAMQGKTAAESVLTALQKQLDAAVQQHAEAVKAQADSQQAVAAAERDLGASIEAHSKAFAALATNPSDQTGKKAAVELSAKMQMRWAEAAARRADLTKSSAAIAAGDTQIAALTPQRDQAKAAVEQLTAKLAEMGPSLQPLKQAAAAAATNVTELSAQLDAARSDLARWQDEVAFLGRYKELSAAVSAREVAVREAEAILAEGQAKVAADEQTRKTLVNERQARAQEIGSLAAAVAKAQQDHAALCQKIAAKQAEMTAAQAAMDQLGKAVGSLEAATANAKSAVDAAPADPELAEVHTTLTKTVAAKTAQVKSLGESHAAMAQDITAQEKEAADMTARGEKLTADMPAVTARMQELDGMIAKTAAAVESSVAVVRALEPLVADRQKEVDAAIGQLLSLQGVPEAPHEPEGVTSDADRE